MEIWDAYNSNFEKIEGLTLIRGEEKNIEKGVYHLVCDIFVKHTDGDYLIMQRDPNKSYGGCWEATAGGSALKGETPYECAKRELKEETGISSDDLKEIGRVVNDDTHSIYVLFFVISDCDKKSVTLQEGETVDYKWVSKEEILNMGDKMISKRTTKYIYDL